jgi:1,4-alpha-glucan branching enzyme
LYEKQFSPEGFQWIDYGDHANSVLTFIRKGHDKKNDLIVALNFTPVLRENYRLGVHKAGKLKEIFNSDSVKYGGSGQLNKNLKVEAIASHNYKKSVELTLPPLGVVIIH